MAATAVSMSEFGDERDPLAAYMRDLRRYPPLPAEEERRLARQYRKGHDPAIARRLAGSQLRLVVRIAREYRTGGASLADLIQEGNLGLLRAIELYDPDRGVRLSNYAAWWIRARILRSVVEGHALVKLGTTATQRRLFFNIGKQRRRLEQEGAAVETGAIARRLGVDEDEVRAMEQRLGPEVSLDEALDDGRTRGELLAAPGEAADVACEDRQLHGRLGQELSRFARSASARERLLLRRRWLADRPARLREVGEELGVSRERVRQIERRMLDRLRERLKASGLG